MKNKPVKKQKRYTVTGENKSKWFIAFDQYISLFIVPIFVFLRAIIFLRMGDAVGFEGLVAGIWIFFAIVTSLVIGLFILLNYYWLKWRMNWWRNILMSIALFLFSSFMLGLIVRMSN